MAVTPENERFYASLAGAQTIARERPLYGAPAVLLLTSGASLAEFVLGGSQCRC